MSNPFAKPIEPKNSFDLFKWLVFEPLLLERFEKTLTRAEKYRLILKNIFVNFFIIIIPLTIILYTISVVIIAAFDLPLIFPPDAPKVNTEVFIQQWRTYSNFWEKVYFFISFYEYISLKNLADGLAFGLAGGLAGGLAFGLVDGLAVGLVGGLASVAWMKRSGIQGG